MNPGSVPPALRGQLAGIARSKAEARQIGHVFGRGAKPKQPIMLVGPDDRTIMIIMGDGVAEAAELEDLALAQIEKAEAKMRQHGRALDFDTLREQSGQMRREEVDAATRQAFADAATRTKQNQRTLGGQHG